jgi:hypothetical protein
MSEKFLNKKQTWGIWLNVIFLGLEGIIYLLAALFLFVFGIVTIVGWIFPVGIALSGFAMILAVLGVLYLWICGGLLRHQKYAWYVTMLLLFVSLILDIIFPLLVGNFAGLFILIVLLIRGYGLVNMKTRKLFKVEF